MTAEAATTTTTAKATAPATTSADSTATPSTVVSARDVPAPQPASTAATPDKKQLSASASKSLAAPASRVTRQWSVPHLPTFAALSAACRTARAFPEVLQGVSSPSPERALCRVSSARVLRQVSSSQPMGPQILGPLALQGWTSPRKSQMLQFSVFGVGSATPQFRAGAYKLPPNMWGIQLTELSEIESHSMFSPGMSSREVVSKVIWPETSGSGVGYALLKNSAGLQSRTMVSHAWAISAAVPFVAYDQKKLRLPFAFHGCQCFLLNYVQQAWTNYTTSHEDWWDDRWGIEQEDPDGEDTYNDNYYQPPPTQQWQDRDVKDFKDRVNAPEFEGIVEDTGKGDGVRNYLRRLEIWEELTTVPKKKQAIVLFYKLKGRAWTDAETLDIKELQKDHGMDIYKAWVRQKYRDLEITTIGDNMKEFFRNLHLKKGQSVREFNNEFDRLWKKLSGMGCGLPMLALAWYYLYKLMITDQQEATLLSSVGNEYDLEKLQKAALTQIRVGCGRRGKYDDEKDKKKKSYHGHYKGDNQVKKKFQFRKSSWKDGRNKQHNVNMTDQPAEESGSSYSGETSSSDEDSDIGEMEEDAATNEHEAYVTMQTAKMKLRDAKNLRGFRGGGKGGGKGDKDYQKKIDDRLQKAKEQSLCARCKQKGHWHKDAVCPLNGGSGTAAASSGKSHQSRYTTHVAFMAENHGNAEDQESAYVARHDVPWSTRAGPEPFLPVGAARLDVPWSTAAGPEPFQPIENEFISYMSGRVGEGGKYYGITDTACSKMVAGMRWYRAFKENVTEAGYVVAEVRESEGFKFGASRTHRSSFAAIMPMGIGGKILVARVSIVPCDVPLLLSRPALEALDMHIHLAGRTADFGAIDLMGYALGSTSAGRPTVVVNEWPEIRVLLSRDMYAGDGREVRLCAVYNKSDEVDVATLGDFWIETYDELIRIHVSRRSSASAPEKYQQYMTYQRPETSERMLAFSFLAEYVPRTRLSQPQSPPAKIFAMAELRPASYMMKNELLEELRGYGANVNPAWTQQELRVVTREERLDRGLGKAKDGVKLPTSKADLVKMCSEEGLVIGPKATCATMRLLLRDFLEAQISGSTVINFGKYDGYTYDELEEKHPNYLTWVIETADKNKDCSRALQTLASWGARRQEKAPEAATKPKPEKSSTTPSQKPKDHTNQRRQREDPEEEAKMDAVPPEEAMEAIQELETRLAVLRQKNGIRSSGPPPGPPPGASSSGASSWLMATSLPGLGESILAGTHSEVEDKKPRAKATKARPSPAIQNDSGTRRRMKKGLRKKLRGGINKAWMITAAVASVCYSCMSAAVSSTVGEFVAPMREVAQVFTTGLGHERPWMLEVFCGGELGTETTKAFTDHGELVLEPRDILFGHDLKNRSERERLYDDVVNLRPRMVWLAFPCRLYGSFTHLNYRTPERKQLLRRLRRREKVFLEITRTIFKIQTSRGDHAAAENPWKSAAWQERPMTETLRIPGVNMFRTDMCAHGLKDRDGEGLHEKATGLMTTSPVFEKHLGKRCQGGHYHIHVQGGSSQRAGRHTRKFARQIRKAVLEIYTRRVYMMADDEEGDASMPLLGGPDPEADQDMEPPVGLIGAAAITFTDSKISPAIKTGLRKLRQNLGHPSNEDLCRSLRLGGAAGEVIKAVKRLRCTTCTRMHGRGSTRPAKLPAMGNFNENVGLDIIVLYDQAWTKFLALSCVDLNTTFHVVTLVKDTQAATLREAFVRRWAEWAGPPKKVHVDLDSGFKAEFAEMISFWGARTSLVAGQAPWQHGTTERQGGWWKTIWAKTVEHETINGIEEVLAAIPEVTQAKNVLRRRNGFSPCQWVTGSDPKLASDLVDHPEDLAAHSQVLNDNMMARRMAIRTAARKSFICCQNDDAIRRALVHRNRVKKHQFEIGEYCYYFREIRQGRNRKPKGQWLGPAVVVGLEGGNSWLSCGGKCNPDGAEFQRLLEELENEEVEYEDARTDETKVEEGIGGRLSQEQKQAVQELGAAEFLRRRALQGPAPARRINLKRAAEEAAQRGNDMSEGEAAEGAEAEVLMVKQKTARTQRKQDEKEIPYARIPKEHLELFQAAAKTQWEQHEKYEAVRPLSLSESKQVRETVDPKRILRSRFAYRDKNAGLRTEQREVPVKAKARLCCGRHLDPDLETGNLRTDAPTVGRNSLHLFLNVCWMLGWKPKTADIEAAFLNGVKAPRGLYMEQPKEGLYGLIIKGVLGLATSPRLWRGKLASSLKEMKFQDLHGQEVQFTQSRLDPCHFLLRDSRGNLVAMLCTHVDDVKLAYQEGYEQVAKRFGEEFPIGEWEELPYTYTGSQYQVEEETGDLVIRQTDYVERRLEPLKVKRGRDDGEAADTEELQDNMSAVGGISWLAGQTRPDLSCGCSMSQKKQKAPRVKDLKETARLIKQAQTEKDVGIRVGKLDKDRLKIFVFHDAAWANVTSGECVEDPTQQQIENKEVYSQIGYTMFPATDDVKGEKGGRANLIDWRSHGCPRVCRSTFAAETMACAEALEAAIAMRGRLLEILHPGLDLRDVDAAMLPIECIADCKSLYDTMHKDGVAKAPSEKRLMLDLSAIREMLMEAVVSDDLLATGGMPMRWIPTEFMLADGMTNVMRNERLLAVLRTGQLKLTQSREREKRHRTAAAEPTAVTAKFPVAILAHPAPLYDRGVEGLLPRATPC
ncbi:unnamed protein product [Polarella glacialis]|uniref:Integrase catalytic domain-containing protein n=1 Tax=Polarella glacialis TaxID=89957 RepID=A0A813FJP4_POLGL|nr:unnamed protein product [Polarella glacialis]